MTETEKMQKLHHLATTGHTLTAEDAAALEIDTPRLTAKKRLSVTKIARLKRKPCGEKVEKATAQITVVSQEVAQMLEQNETLRRENIALRR